MHNIHLKREMFENVSKKFCQKKKNEKRENEKEMKKAYRLPLMPIEWKANRVKLCALQTCLRFVPFNDFHDISRKQQHFCSPYCSLVSLSLFEQ